MRAIRLGLMIAVCFIARGVADGQTPVAPPPHPPLDELVTEYRRFGLPVPPAQAELVRYRRWAWGPAEGEVLSYLGFRLPPAAPGSPTRYLTGTWHRDGVDPDTVAVAPPTVDALQHTEILDQILPLAIQCRIRGWNDLSAELYARARELGQEIDRPPLQDLRDEAWGYWEYELTQPKSDWKAAHKYLRLLAEADEKYRTDQNGTLLYSLEAALFHKRTARPGTPEALIDDLIDHREDSSDRENTDGQEAYWKLAALGFDAVPALLDHRHDDRLTRTFSMDLGPRHAHHVTVGVLCSRLVFLLSARQADPEFWDARGDYLDTERATAWYVAARAGGEEKWLLDHALPASGGGGIVNHPHSPEKVIVRALAAKYPARLPALYRAALRGPIADSLNDFVPEIVASRMPCADAAALLTEGASHPQLKHRYNALEGLAQVDRPLFSKRLRQTLALVTADGKGAPEGISWFAELVGRDGDPACWDALAVALNRMDADDRCEVASLLGSVEPWRSPDPIRRNRLRLLLPMLKDSEGTTEDYEVRDCAAAQLAGLFGLPMMYRGPGERRVYVDRELGPLTRFALRCVVRRAAELELATGEDRRP